MAAVSKVFVCGRLLAGTGGFEFCRECGWQARVCCVLSGLCIRLVTGPEESYLVRCVGGCDREVPIMRKPWPTGGCCTIKIFVYLYKKILIVLFFLLMYA